MMRKILEVVLHPERFESDWLGESRRGLWRYPPLAERNGER
jgi:hypothetical protein